MTPSRKHMHRAAAVALLVLGVWALWAALLSPIVNYAREAWSEHYQSEARLAELKELIGRQDAIAAQLRILEQDPGWSRLYRAPSASAATAMAQGDIQSVAQSLGLVFASIQPLAEREVGPLSNVGARITFDAPIDVVVAFARRLSASPRILFVEDVTILAPQLRVGDANPPLNVQADVYGIWWR